jgi:hypothetical protein
MSGIDSLELNLIFEGVEWNIFVVKTSETGSLQFCRRRRRRRLRLLLVRR